MKLGVEFPQEWKAKSEEEGIRLPDILYGYAVEDFLLRIEKSSFREWLWITNEAAIGTEAYKKVSKERLEFLYIEKEKKSLPFSPEVRESLLKEVLFQEEENKRQITWDCTIKEVNDGVDLYLNGFYMDMQVPVSVSIRTLKLEKQVPKEKELPLMFETKKKCRYLSYSKENVLSEAVFEIMRKLELISDMKEYDQINDILKTQSVNGRHIIEELKKMGQAEPKVVSMKRYTLMVSYKDYGYMKKRWNQYTKKQPQVTDEWEEVMRRILNFLEPVWKALCENEVFFDDWMPELERFLG